MFKLINNSKCFSRNSVFLVFLFVIHTVHFNSYFVNGLLEEEKQPTFLTAGVGDHIAFNCELDFPHEIEIPYSLHWYKHNQEIFSVYEGTKNVLEEYQGRIQLLNSGKNGFGKGSINVTNIRETDSGWYECRVMFPNRSPVSRNNGTWFYLTVDGANLLAIPPMNITILEGEEAYFPCITKNMDTKVSWFKDGVPLNEYLDLSHRSWQSDNGSLIINPTAMGDLGEYRCEAINENGESQSARAYLNVQYKAKVVYAPREVFFAYGRPALLDCHYHANPPLTNLRWMKDGYLFDPYNVQGVFYRRNGSLYFSRVDESHNGQYACTPYNDLGTAGPSPNINVVVRRPPVFTVKPHNLYLKKLGETVDMHCDAIDGDGVHKPIIKWSRKDLAPLPAGRHIIQGGNISIEKIQVDDRGLYECTATNEAATITVETELMVENIAPRAPYNLTANSTQNSVIIRWVPGYIRPYLEYSIWYRPTDTQEWRTMRILSSKTTEGIITNLTPNREYEFMVLSQDKHGDGMFSKALRIFTKKENGDFPDYAESRSTIGAFQQIGAPVNLSVKLTTEGYLVTWDPPNFGREILKTYMLQWTKGPNEILVGTTETKENYYIVQNLDEDETYYFQVLAVSTNEYEARSSKYVLTIPAYKKIKAISIGIIIAIAILGSAFAGLFYARKKWCLEYISGSDSRKPMTS
ncbi:protein borderless isoform X2 [Chrysoperla carnea]|uniref:protein borderless isoform X2 n=1 Tax=Chrysoperla carnea TaxID=189513 RepID=UPI001D05E166|nr:protein borderless isoform X2 [Chrysoperla carnea]